MVWWSGVVAGPAPSLPTPTLISSTHYSLLWPLSSTHGSPGPLTLLPHAPVTGLSAFLLVTSLTFPAMSGLGHTVSSPDLSLPFGQVLSMAPPPTLPQEHRGFMGAKPKSLISGEGSPCRGLGPPPQEWLLRSYMLDWERLHICTWL